METQLLIMIKIKLVKVEGPSLLALNKMLHLIDTQKLYSKTTELKFGGAMNSTKLLQYAVLWIESPQ